MTNKEIKEAKELGNIYLGIAKDTSIKNIRNNCVTCVFSLSNLCTKYNTSLVRAKELCESDNYKHYLNLISVKNAFESGYSPYKMECENESGVVVIGSDTEDTLRRFEYFDKGE